LAFLSVVFVATDPRAQTVTVTSAPNIGTVAAAASGVTTFYFNSATGAVSHVSGAGARVSFGATNALITLSCNSKWCHDNNLDISVTNTGSPTGRAGPLTDFTAAMGNAVLNTGTPSTPANPLTFQIQPMGTISRTFTIGASFPIYGDEQTGKPTGPASSGFLVTMSDTNKANNSASQSGSAAANVLHHMSISVGTDSNGFPLSLNFGRVVLNGGAGSVSMPASSGALTVVGATALSSPTPSLGGFVVSGEGGQVISLSINGGSPIVVTNTTRGSATLSITPSVSPPGSQTLSGSLGGTGSRSYSIGGAFTLTAGMSTGAYSGTYAVTANYN
jgi:hypothetical protein